MNHSALTLETLLPMLRILAVETATDACSVAFCDGVETKELFQVAPRQHSTLTFTMLEQLAARQPLGVLNPELIAYGSGPGSFTGLRIAASLAQGLSYAMNVPALGVSTLEALAAGAWRSGTVPADRTILACLDARIGQLYVASFSLQGGVVQTLTAPVVVRPQDVELPGVPGELALLGDGAAYLSGLPGVLRDRVVQALPSDYPHASDIIAIARSAASDARPAGYGAILPNYVHPATQWKTLAEQQALRT